MAHPGKTQAPGRAKAGQGGVDVPTQTPPQGGLKPAARGAPKGGSCSRYRVINLRHIG